MSTNAIPVDISLLETNLHYNVPTTLTHYEFKTIGIINESGDLLLDICETLDSDFAEDTYVNRFVIVASYRGNSYYGMFSIANQELIAQAPLLMLHKFKFVDNEQGRKLELII